MTLIKSYLPAALFMVLFLSTGTAAGAVLTNLNGIVLNGETHEPLENVYVSIAGLKLSSSTDQNGRFSFSGISEGSYKIKFYLLGFKPHEVNVNIAKSSNNRSIYIHLFPVSIQSSAVIITGEHPTTNLDRMLEETNILKGKDLQRDMGLTLASTLRNETGISIRSMGPAPSRPVIRGLSGDRVVISEDGNNTNDLSSSSPDHAVTVEPFTADRIEVLRGPKVLQKTSSTIGGVVNIIREEIPDNIPERFSGNAGLLGETVNKGYLYSLVGELPLSSIVLRGEFSNKRAGNLRTPGGVLKNSDLKTFNFSGGLSLIRPWGMLGFSIRQFSSDYGVPGGFVGAHPFGVDISMFKRQMNGKLLLNFNSGFLNKAELNISRVYYHHTEYEYSGIVGAEFSTYNYSGGLHLYHNEFLLSDNGVLGLTIDYRDFNIGGFVFTPPSRSLNISAYLYESRSLNDFDFQFAARYNFDDIKPDREIPDSRIGNIRQRKFGTYSLSASALYELGMGFFTGVNLSKSSRVPTIEELFSQGPHLAAYSYETGNPELQDERGFGSEVFAYYKAHDFLGMITLFRNDLSYFILPRNSGRINFSTLLPVYATTGESALMTGAEAQADWNFYKGFSISASAGYTYGKLKNYDSPLPSVPPLKGRAELKYNSPAFSAGLSQDFAAGQYRVDQFEMPTNGYSVFNSYLQYIFPLGGYINNLIFNADNVFNREYRNHLSRVKAVMPESGRNFRLTYRVFF